MSKEDKAAEMARRKEERKQVCGNHIPAGELVTNQP